MKIIISPAKRMKEDTDGMPVLGMPPFPEKTGMLYEYLKGLSLEELKALLRCNDSMGRTGIDNTVPLGHLLIDRNLRDCRSETMSE